ncbi:hypothetical protein D3C87_1353240 [compost metagenome]
MAAKRAQRIAARALANHDYVGVIFRFYREHVPGVFHIRKLSHARLLIKHFFIVDHDIFDEAENWITGVFQLEYATPRQVLHRRNKEGDDAENQAQIFSDAPRLFLLWRATHCNDAERKNKQADDVAVPREDGQNFRRLFHIGGVQRQQGVEVRRAVSLTKRVIHRSNHRTDPHHHFLRAR